MNMVSGFFYRYFCNYSILATGAFGVAMVTTAQAAAEEKGAELAPAEWVRVGEVALRKAQSWLFPFLSKKVPEVSWVIAPGVMEWAQKVMESDAAHQRALAEQAEVDVTDHLFDTLDDYEAAYTRCDVKMEQLYNIEPRMTQEMVDLAVEASRLAGRASEISERLGFSATARRWQAQSEMMSNRATLWLVEMAERIIEENPEDFAPLPTPPVTPTPPATPTPAPAPAPEFPLGYGPAAPHELEKMGLRYMAENVFSAPNPLLWENLNPTALTNCTLFPTIPAPIAPQLSFLTNIVAKLSIENEEFVHADFLDRWKILGWASEVVDGGGSDLLAEMEYHIFEKKTGEVVKSWDLPLDVQAKLEDFTTLMVEVLL